MCSLPLRIVQLHPSENFDTDNILLTMKRSGRHQIVETNYINRQTDLSMNVMDEDTAKRDDEVGNL